MVYGHVAVVGRGRWSDCRWYSSILYRVKMLVDNLVGVQLCFLGMRFSGAGLRGGPASTLGGVWCRFCSFSIVVRIYSSWLGCTFPVSHVQAKKKLATAIRILSTPIKSWKPAKPTNTAAAARNAAWRPTRQEVLAPILDYNNFIDFNSMDLLWALGKPGVIKGTVANRCNLPRYQRG